MNTETISQKSMEDSAASLKLKLAALWTSFMFLYIYVDLFALFMPGKLADIQSGRVFIFDITQEFILSALVSVTIPALMIFVSAALPPKTNRRINIIIALLYIPFTLFNLVGEIWIHMVFAAAVEIALLCLIIRYAWQQGHYATPVAKELAPNA